MVVGRHGGAICEAGVQVPAQILATHRELARSLSSTQTANARLAFLLASSRAFASGRERRP